MRMLSFDNSNNSFCSFSETNLPSLGQPQYRQNRVGSPLGLEISSIQEANENCNNSKDDALAIEDQWALPKRTHKIRSQKIIKDDGYENKNDSGVCAPTGQSFVPIYCSIF